MTITLDPEDEKLVSEKVRSGQFDSADAVVSHALQTLREVEEAANREKQSVRKLLDDAWEKANDPETRWIPGEVVFERLRRKTGERRRLRE